MGPGLFVVVSGPSGVGKSTLVELAIAEGIRTGEFSSARLVTMTTRAPRPNEQDGVDYHFISRERFIEIKEAGGFLENEENYGALYLYGSPLADLERMQQTYDVVFGVLDPKGARTVRQRFGDEALIVALTADSEILEARLVRRFGDIPNLSVRIASFAEDMRVATEAAHYTVASIEGRKDGAMFRVLELIRHRRSLRH